MVVPAIERDTRSQSTLCHRHVHSHALMYPLNGGFAAVVVDTGSW